jgi:hypothetical protein
MRYGWEDASGMLMLAIVTFPHALFPFSGAVRGRYQVSRHASYETISRYGAAVGWRKNCGGAGPIICNPQVQNFDSILVNRFFVSDMQAPVRGLP